MRNSNRKCKALNLHHKKKRKIWNVVDRTSLKTMSIPQNTTKRELCRNAHNAGTRRERLKSALYLRLKIRKRLFFEKKTWNFWIFFQKMSHSAKKCKRGDPLGFIKIYSVANYQKTQKGDSFETLKNFRYKVSQCWKKIEPFSLVRFL